MRLIETNTAQSAINTGNAFRAIIAHAIASGWSEDEARGMARDLDAAIFLTDDQDRAYELADAMDVVGAGYEVVGE